MTLTTKTNKVHKAALMYAKEFKSGLLDRREFLTRTTALGVSAAAAYTLGGLQAPAQAGSHMQQGGTLRIQQQVRALKDARTWDWTQISNFARGWLEYLVEYNRDGTFRGILLESWEANDDATVWTCSLRENVTFHDGSTLDANDVVMSYAVGLDASSAYHQGNIGEFESFASMWGLINVEEVVEEEGE